MERGEEEVKAVTIDTAYNQFVFVVSLLLTLRPLGAAEVWRFAF
jgi:hypothetical protein